MRLALYVHACRQLAQELIESLTQNEIVQLRADLDGMTLLEWIGYRHSRAPEIAAYVAMTPSRRNKKHPPGESGLLVYAAIQHCLEAAELLEQMEQMDLHPGASYRSVAGRAGTAFAALRDCAVCEWPFAGASPFE